MYIHLYTYIYSVEGENEVRFFSVEEEYLVRFRTFSRRSIFSQIFQCRREYKQVSRCQEDY